MKLKNIPYYSLLSSFTAGASLIIGLLSFGGALFLGYSLYAAIGFLFISAIYEMQIYLINQNGALNKLTKENYLETQISQDYLSQLMKEYRKALKENKAQAKEDFPEFFQTYHEQSKKLHELGHKRLDDQGQKVKRLLEKNIKTLERSFAKTVFSGCRLFLMSNKAIPFKKSDANHLYLYKDEAGNINYQMLGSDEIESLYNEDIKEALEKETFEASAENPIACAKQELCDNVFNEASKRGHTLFSAEPTTEYRRNLKANLVELDRKLEEKRQVKQKSKLTDQARETLAKLPSLKLQSQHLEEELKSRAGLYQIAKIFSVFTTLFASFGTTYLILEVIEAISFLSFLTPLILPMALWSGIAFGLLTYNATTDMINNKTFVLWMNDLVKLRYYKEWGFKESYRFFRSVFLVGLALTLSFCTMGSWWFAIKEGQALFSWMKRVPSLFIGLFSGVLGLAGLSFNLENNYQTADTFKKLKEKITASFQHLKESINKQGLFQYLYGSVKGKISEFFKAGLSEWLERFNLFRLPILVLETPLRVVLFLLHIAGIGIAEDRLTEKIGILSEGLEDGHYFIHLDHDDHGHHHGHSHDSDIPTLLLKGFFSPFYMGASLWSWGVSQLASYIYPETERRLSFLQAWEKQWTGKIAKPAKPELLANSISIASSHEIVLTHLEKLETKATKACDKEKIQAFSTLKEQVAAHQGDKEALAQLIRQEAKNNPVFAQKYSFFATGKSSQESLETLADRIAPLCAAPGA